MRKRIWRKRNCPGISGRAWRALRQSVLSACDCKSFVYRSDRKTNLVQTAGTDGGTYAPVASVETDKTWETDDMFLLWDEDWALESAYSHEPTGYVACPADLIQGLRMQFPDVTYRTADFRIMMPILHFGDIRRWSRRWRKIPWMETGSDVFW